MKTAVITGVTGQDGSYLSELLLEKDYKVIGVYRRCSVDNTLRILQCVKDYLNFVFVEGDVTDVFSINSILQKYQPDEYYNLAAQSHVGTSFYQPLLTWKVNAEAVVIVLEVIKQYSQHTKLYQASTSEMFGKNYSEREHVNELKHTRFNELGRCLYDFTTGKQNFKYQDFNTPFAPQSPYAVAKLAAHNSVQLYRDAYDLHVSSGVLFNHEAPRRGLKFVTRKITSWIGSFVNAMEDARSNLGIEYDGPRYINTDEGYIGFDGNWTKTFPMLRLGNLDTYRDWGHAKDYVYAMWLMLQQEKPDDFIIATGESHSIKEFLDCAFGEVGLDWSSFVIQDPKYMRPAEVNYLRGDCSKANTVLG